MRSRGSRQNPVARLVACAVAIAAVLAVLAVHWPRAGAAQSRDSSNRSGQSKNAAPSPSDRAARPRKDERQARHEAFRTRRLGRPFWAWAAAPHEPEIAVVLTKASELLANATPDARERDVPLPHDTRARMLADAFGMLRYAHRLDPDNDEVRQQLGFAAAETGRVGLAIEMLEQSWRHTARGRTTAASVHVGLRLGRLYAATGAIERAIAVLEAAALPDEDEAAASTSSLQAAVELSVLLASRGEMARAIDSLVVAQGHRNTNTRFGFRWDTGLLQFALAVAYDKDEQITRAYEQLALLAGSPGGFLGPSPYRPHRARLGAMRDIDELWAAVAELELSPPVERHYFQALLYESQGMLEEARAEWRAYTRGGEAARFRARAAGHIRAIEALLAGREPRARRRATITTPNP